MAIVVGVFWVIVGAVFILYQVCRENQVMGILITETAAFMILMIILGCNLIETDWYLPVMISCLAAYIILHAVFIGRLILQIRKDKEDGEKVVRERRKKEVSEKFNKAGYHITDEMINMLIDDSSSPLNRDDDKIFRSLSSCYEWLCFSRELDLNMMDNSKLEKLIGVPINELPLLKNTDYGWAILIRKSLVVRYILNQDGLTFNKFSNNKDRLQKIDDPNYIDEFEIAVARYKNSHKEDSL